MKVNKILLVLMSFLISSGVMAELSESSLVPKEEMNFAKNYLGKIRNKDFDYVMSHIDPELSNKISMENLKKIAGYFPDGEPTSIELIGSQVNTYNSTWQGNFTFEYKFESSWAIANAAVKRINQKTTVIGFSVYRTPASQKQLNQFVLSDKTFLQYAVLAMVCIIPLFILASLIFCIKTPIPKRKWLWVIFVLGGIGTISVNWTTGAYEIKVLQYLLFGASGGAASEHAPWVFSVGIPIGAIIFWFKRNSFISQYKANK